MRYSGLNSLCPQGVRLYLPLPTVEGIYYFTANVTDPDGNREILIVMKSKNSEMGNKRRRR
jgi:hypothetical protein